MKNIEWLKEEIPNLRGYAVIIDGEDGNREPITTVSVKDVFELINQLDEPEKEPKYYVDLDTAAYVAKWVGDGSVQIYTDSVSGSDEYELHLTEQEIKDYDERYWALAVKVKELEE